MGKIAEGLFLIAFGLVLMLPIMALLSLPVMWLWNDLMPGLFKLRPISFGEAFELLLLCGLLIKSGSYGGSKS